MSFGSSPIMWKLCAKPIAGEAKAAILAVHLAWSLGLMSFWKGHFNNHICQAQVQPYWSMLEKCLITVEIHKRALFFLSFFFFFLSFCKAHSWKNTEEMKDSGHSGENTKDSSGPPFSCVWGQWHFWLNGEALISCPGRVNSHLGRSPMPLSQGE